MTIVLQKFIAESGYSSRRKAEEFIRNGKVTVNGVKAELGQRVKSSDGVKVNGKLLKIENEKKYIILNKPKGYTCTNRKFKGEKNVFDLVKTSERLYVVGRLDKDSKGLVLLTNDGALTQKMTHPKFRHEKEYVVRIANCELRVENIINKFKKGVNIGEESGVVRAKDVKYLQNDQFRLILTEGKKRQIREMFKAVGCKVVDLERVRVGNLELGNLKAGKWEYINKNNII